MRGIPGRSVTMAPGFTPGGSNPNQNDQHHNFQAPSPSSTMYSDDPYSPFPAGAGEYSPYPQYRDRPDEQNRQARQQTFAGVSGSMGGGPEPTRGQTISESQGQTQTGSQGRAQAAEDVASTGSATFPSRARTGRRTKTVQELWFGGVSRDETLLDLTTEEPEEIDEEGAEEDDEGADGRDEKGKANEENQDEVVVKDGERELTLPWARSVALVVSKSSEVTIDVQLVRPHTSVPKEEIREVPLVPGLTAGAEQQQGRGRAVESIGQGMGNGKPRFLFRFRGSYAKVLFAKSALRREITPEVSRKRGGEASFSTWLISVDLFAGQGGSQFSLDPGVFALGALPLVFETDRSLAQHDHPGSQGQA